MERYCQSDSTVAYAYQREKDRESDIESVGSDSVFTDRASNRSSLLANGSLLDDGSLVDGCTDDGERSRLNTSDLVDFGTISTYSKASGSTFSRDGSTNDKEISICEGGRVEVIPDKDTSIVLSDKTDLVETNLKDTISPKKTKTEDDDLYESSEVIFKLKKWNHVCLWQWDVENDVCAICRIVILEPCLNCQTTANGPEDCSVVWGMCNHTFHNCCLGRWLVQTNRCPLCQQEWVVQRIGK